MTRLFFLLLLAGCVSVPPEHIQFGGATYIQGPATTAVPLPGLPDLGPHQLILLTPESEKMMTAHTPLWGCTAFDIGSTVVGLSVGLSEASPLGLLVIPYAFWYSTEANTSMKNGDMLPAKVASAVHCGAGTLNAAQIAAVVL